jgi:hypothetical protein
MERESQEPSLSSSGKLFSNIQERRGIPLASGKNENAATLLHHEQAISMIRTGGEKKWFGKCVFRYGLQSNGALDRGRFSGKTPARSRQKAYPQPDEESRHQGGEWYLNTARKTEFPFPGKGGGQRGLHGKSMPCYNLISHKKKVGRVI